MGRFSCSLINLAVALMLGFTNSVAASTEATEAVRLSDPFEVRRLLSDGSPLSNDERLLLEGADAAFRLDDKRAQQKLSRIASDPSVPPALRRTANIVDGTTALRAGNYRKAANRLADALQLSSVTPVLADHDLKGLRQTFGVAQALRGVAAQQRKLFLHSSINLTRDTAGLQVAAIDVNGHPQSAVIDTGANFSVVAKSTALSLGLRLVGSQIEVSSPSSARTSGQMAIAKRLKIGGATFANVVFLVLADADLTFANGAYKIDAIVGFPILSRLERLEFSTTDGREVLQFGPSKSGSSWSTDLFIDGLTPKLLLDTPYGNRKLIFALDTGADKTTLRPRFGAAYPQVVGNANEQQQTAGGAGATITRKVQTIENIVLLIDGREHVLGPVSLFAEEFTDSGVHGRIGQDLIRSQQGYVLDFRKMDFELINQ